MENMRLSEAIRLGAAMKGQVRGVFYSIQHGVPATCAWGAAFDAVGKLEEINSYLGPIIYSVTFDKAVNDMGWKETAKAETFCPACARQQNRTGSILSLIVHLNDCHRWTREAIANWVEQQERGLGLWQENNVTEAPTTQSSSSFETPETTLTTADMEELSTSELVSPSA